MKEPFLSDGFGLQDDLSSSKRRSVAETGRERRHVAVVWDEESRFLESWLWFGPLWLRSLEGKRQTRSSRCPGYEQVATHGNSLHIYSAYMCIDMYIHIFYVYIYMYVYI